MPQDYGRNGKAVGVSSAILEEIGLSDDELKKLKDNVTSVNCKAIKVNKDKSIALRFKGISSLYQFEYYLPKESKEIPEGYEKLANGIYFGLYDCGIICGDRLYKSLL